MMLKVLVTYAVQGEFAEIKWPDIEPYYVRTGIGKMKSAYFLSEVIRQVEPDVVINQGTAGSVGHRVGEVIVCDRFIDRDMKKLAGMGAEYEIDASALLASKGLFPEWQGRGICNSGDSFLASPGDMEGDVADMEAYAQAFVCRAKGIPFVAVKYVSNVLGEKVAEQPVEEKMAEIRRRLSEFFIGK